MACRLYTHIIRTAVNDQIDHSLNILYKINNQQMESKN